MRTIDKWEIGIAAFFVLLFIVITAYYPGNTTNYNAASYSMTAPDINIEWGGTK